MSKVFSDELYDYYEIEVKVDVICLRYFFKLVDNNDNICYYGNYRFYNKFTHSSLAMRSFILYVSVVECFCADVFICYSNIYP